MIQVFSYPLGERSFHLFVDLKQAIVSISGGLSPHNFEMCSISPQQACSLRCWFPNNSVITFLEGCFPSSFVAEVVIFFSIPLFQWSIFYFFPEAWWCCSLHSSSRVVRTVFFSCLSISNRSVVPSFQVLPILSSFASLLNRSAVWNLSYPLCHSFNSSGGSVLLISSSILSSCQVHVQFLPFTVGVLPKLYHSYSFPILF